MGLLAQTDVHDFVSCLVDVAVPRIPVIDGNYPTHERARMGMRLQLTHVLLYQARNGSYENMAAAIAVLLNQQTEQSRQHWYIDANGRLDYHDCNEVCDMCNMHTANCVKDGCETVLCDSCKRECNNANHNN